MAAVDPGYAQWLQADALNLRARPAGADRWSDAGAATRALSPFALHDDAAAECTRQAALLAGPLVRDRVRVTGARCGLVGRAIRIAGDRLGYDAAPIVLVIAAEEQEAETVLTVIRPNA